MTGDEHHPVGPPAAAGGPPRDQCGVFGVYAPGEDVATLTYFGLYALQHRGQESAGIAVGDGQQLLVYKDMGLVAQVFDEAALATLRGHVAVGHTRYSTTGATTWHNAQPTLGVTGDGAHTVALAHNGNLTNTPALREELAAVLAEGPRPARGGDLHHGASTDTAVVTGLLGAWWQGSVLDTAVEVLGRLRGAYCFVFADEDTLYAARDPHGIRPLVLGRLSGGRGWVVASETAALDIVGAQAERDVEPGELIALGPDGVTSRRFADPQPSGCVFERVYLARPDSHLDGQQVYDARVAMGRRLAGEHPAEADLVMPVPESGTPAAIGYAEASGLAYGHGVVKNAYVGRTFIQPSQAMRQLGIRLKLNPLRHVIEGRRLAVVDDSIVRGNTQRALVAMLREAGAAEVHVRISSPPVLWPCYYGVDFASRAELVAPGRNPAEVAELIGADSLGYLSLDGMISATGVAAERLCTACFTGDYPVERATGPAAGQVELHLTGVS